MPDITLEQLVNTLAAESGPDLRGYKVSTLERRVRKRMFDVGVGTYADYLEQVRAAPTTEPTALLNTVLINVTEFFRDPAAWEMLRNHILPGLLRSVPRGEAFRAWCAGCATGEEAYSLAILISEILGPSLPEYDVKIYATDVDEDALSIARRGEYPLERLRRVRPEWRERYFTGATRLRIARDLRRLLIFGRSSLTADAPISHCNLVMCRNVLIYFDVATQRYILDRLHYALARDGVLFLGKAESKLNESELFRPLDARWRIFQRTRSPLLDAQSAEAEIPMAEKHDDKVNQQMQRLAAYQRSMLDTMKPGIIALDERDIVLMHNDAALAVWGLSGQLNGKRLAASDIATRCPELSARLDALRSKPETVTFQCSVSNHGEDRRVAVTLRPVFTDSGQRSGTLMYAEDVSDHDKLQTTFDQLEATSEELQSSNEELETTNEELQSTNEELETTNEELQSTNEELETTNEELQSLNEELETMNEELERRSLELNVVHTHYQETLRGMPWPVMLVDGEQKIQLWNAAAQRVFGVGETSVVGVSIDRLPMGQALRASVARRATTVLARKQAGILRNQRLRPGDRSLVDIHFTPIARDGTELDGVLVMFGPTQTERDGRANGARGSRPPAAMPRKPKKKAPPRPKRRKK